MSEERHLLNPPVTEAVVDFRVKARPDVTLEAFESLREELRDDFPVVGKQHLVKTTLDIGQAGTPSTEHSVLGLRFHTEDKLNIAQFRLDGFTFNRLRPYTSWEFIWTTAFNLWKKYQKAASPIAVTRMALRYINHIDLPPGDFGLKDVVKYPPAIPNELRVAITRFRSRVTVRDVERELTAHISQVIEPGPGPHMPIFILDIDAFYQKGLVLAEGDTDAKIHEVFDKLRKFKNDIFFATMCETMISRFR